MKQYKRECCTFTGKKYIMWTAVPKKNDNGENNCFKAVGKGYSERNIIKSIKCMALLHINIPVAHSSQAVSSIFQKRGHY